MYPEHLKYTAEHEWAATDGDRVRVGITSYAQEQLGDIVFVSLPAVGTVITIGEPFGEVESTKSVSELYAPVSGTVVTVNETLDATPEQLNTDPYGAGWLVEIEPAEAGQLDGLMDAAAYAAQVSDG